MRPIKATHTTQRGIVTMREEVLIVKVFPKGEDVQAVYIDPQGDLKADLISTFSNCVPQDYSWSRKEES
jgi:hypothetical protein